MKITNVLGAVAASAMLLGLAIPASAASLMNVTTTGTTTINGCIKSDTSSWDSYSGVQISATLTDAANSSTVGNLSKTSLLNVSSAQQNFSGQANVEFFKGGDSSYTGINGQIHQTQTTTSTGIQTSFGN